jgi:outer membrane lipopolysaccharide assembly protein LptE/RlpB
MRYVEDHKSQSKAQSVRDNERQSNVVASLRGENVVAETRLGLVFIAQLIFDGLDCIHSGGGDCR